MTDDEQEFTNACKRSIDECRKLGYIPSIWIRMINEHGAVETARRLIKSGDLQDGLLKLLNYGRVDLTVEQAVIDERWHNLFTDEERDAARWRLGIAQREC
jgi:hypothetical protein